MASLLRQFYASMRQKSGDYYSKSAYINIRASLQRHITSHPYQRTINIMHDREFQTANKVFSGSIKEMRRLGKDKTKHKEVITDLDFQTMYESGVLSLSNPVSLQRKVFVDIGLHFARRGREGLRSLSKNSFVVKSVGDRRYITMSYNEMEKNHQGTEHHQNPEKQAVMFDSPDDALCPVKSFELYVSKLHPEQEAFYQYSKPLTQWNHSMNTWYQNKPIGVTALGEFMKKISVDANLSQIYTNHCLRATSATTLSHAGVEASDICHITGHRNIQSLQSYTRGATMDKLQTMSGILHSKVASSYIQTYKDINAVFTFMMNHSRYLYNR